MPYDFILLTSSLQRGSGEKRVDKKCLMAVHSAEHVGEQVGCTRHHQTRITPPQLHLVGVHHPHLHTTIPRFQGQVLNTSEDASQRSGSPLEGRSAYLLMRHNYPWASVWQCSRLVDAQLHLIQLLLPAAPRKVRGVCCMHSTLDFGAPE